MSAIGVLGQKGHVVGLGVEEFSRVVSRLYAAPGRPEAWQAAFVELTETMQATACSLVLATPTEPFIAATTISAEAAAAYRGYYHQLDFVLEESHSGPVGLVNSGYELVARHRDTEFHIDWQRRHDMADGLHVRLGAPTPTSFVVSAPPGSHRYATSERVRFVDALVPHLQHALNTHQRLTATGQHPASLRAAAELSFHGVVVVGRAGRIVTMNTAAEALTARRDGLRVIDQRLRVDGPDLDAALQAAVHSAVGGRRRLIVRGGGHLVCVRPSGARPYVLRVVPLDTTDDPEVGLAAVVITDPDHLEAPSKPLLQDLFGLTATEAEVALRMLDGSGLPAVAVGMGLALSTVKTHAHNVFVKTRTRRQAELVRLLTAITA